MRRWNNTIYDHVPYMFISDDGYYITYDLEKDHWLVWTPNRYIIALFDNRKLLKEKAAIYGSFNYLLYKAEWIITIYEARILRPFKKIREAHMNEVTHAKALLNTEYGISTQIRRISDEEARR